MIQRVQSIYLLLVVVIGAALPFVFPLWVNEVGTGIYAVQKPLVMGAFGLSALLALIALFLYKNRKLQFVLGRLNIILNFFLLGFFVYRTLSMPGGVETPEKGIGMLLPVVSIVFLVLANKAIKKDEDLVKSVDRLR